MIPQKVLVASASPDQLNMNAALRGHVARGLQAAFGDMDVLAVPYEAALSAAATFRPDLAVIFGSVMIDGTDYYRFVDSVHRHGGRVAFWLHDDPYEFDANDRIFPLADVVFSNDEASLDFYPPNVEVHHLPLAACPSAHYRRIQSRAAPNLFFCGHLFENRARFFAQLEERIPELDEQALLIGTGSRYVHLSAWRSGTLPGAALPDFYASAWAVLNIGRDLNLANERFGIRASTPGPRTFEAAMAGGAQIFVGDGLEILRYFDEGREILLADGIEQFVEHWQRLLDDPALSLQIGRAAQARAEAEHRYEHRAKKLIQLASG